MRVGRKQVLGYRVAAHGLADGAAARSATASGAANGGAANGGLANGGLANGGLANGAVPSVLELGVQDTPAGSGRLAFAARGLELSDGLVLAWTVRGAPHWHPAPALWPLAQALWPRSSTDGLAKVSWERSRVLQSGVTIQEALATVVDALRAVVVGPTVKGAVSAAVTARIPAGLSYECRVCRSTHVFDSLLRLAALAAGLRLVPDASPATLEPIEGWPGRPAEQSGADALVRAYLRLLGPAGPAEVAAWLGSTPADIRAVWPDELVKVDVDGRTAWLPEAEVDALSAVKPARTVRLLPPSDPYLQARDRALLLPDPAARKVLWPAIGAPGAVLVDGEIVGAWRAKASGKRKLRINVTTFGGLSPHDRAIVTEQADTVARVRGMAEVTVGYDG